MQLAWIIFRGYWKPIVAVLIVLLVWNHGFKTAKQRCNAANLKAEIVELKRQAEASKVVHQWAQKANEIRQNEIEQLAKKVENYESDIDQSSDNGCGDLSADDAHRLQSIK